MLFRDAVRFLRQLPRVGSSLRVMEEHHPRGLGNRFVEEFKAFRAQFRCHACNTCQISTTPSETCDMLEWVARVDNKRCTLHGFSDDARRPRAHREENIDWHLREFSG